MGRLAGHALAGRAFLAMNRIDDAKNELELAEREMEHVPTGSLGALPNAGILRAEILLHDQKFPQADAALKQIEASIRAMPGPDSWSEALFQLQSIARSCVRARRLGPGGIHRETNDRARSQLCRRLLRARRWQQNTRATQLWPVSNLRWRKSYGPALIPICPSLSACAKNLAPRN